MFVINLHSICVVMFECLQLHVYMFIIFHGFEPFTKYLFQLCQNVVKTFCKDILAPFWYCIMWSEYEHVNNVFVFCFTICSYWCFEYPYMKIRICILYILWIRKLFPSILPLNLHWCNTPCNWYCPCKH